MSAVFNVVFIPALAVLFAKDKDGNAVSNIKLDKASLLRDGFWVILSDVALIAMIFYGYISIWMALLLNLIYVGYAVHLYIDSKGQGPEGYEDEQLDDRGTLGNILTFNFNKLLFGGREINGYSAVRLLIIATVIIVLGSHLMVEGVIGSAELFGIPGFISGLILGAAASSVPDLLLSVGDAKKGNYEDAVSNPLASNTFDTTLSVGLPLLVWLIWNGQAGIDIVAENMEALRISVVALSVCVCATLVHHHRNITKSIAIFMLGLYAAWCMWIITVYL